MTMTIDQGWRVRAGRTRSPELPGTFDPDRELPAQVPGCIHEALADAGVLADYRSRLHEQEQRWVGSTEWDYVSRFDLGAPLGEAVLELRLDGIATVVLDGQVRGTADSVHRTAVVRLGPLAAGRHELEVRFVAAVPHAEAEEQRLGWRPHVEKHPFNAVRRMACSFGWDWGPDLATSGFREAPILLDDALPRLDGVRWQAVPVDAGGSITVAAKVHNPPAGSVLRLESAGRTATRPATAGDQEIGVHLDEVDLWWPQGHGGQTLYPARLVLAAPDGAELAAQEADLGFRTVEWRQPPAPAGAGSGFECWVNGRFVHIRGACWIPDHPFLHRAHGPEVAAGVATAARAHLNMLRVWGGGTWESERFYRECDRLGILVWQDFPFTGAGYSESAAFRDGIQAECREALTRLSAHPSLGLLCGNNEVLWAVEDWPGWAAHVQQDAWGALYFHDLFPGWAADLAPGVTYVPGSPFSPTGHGHNDSQDGCCHLWELWNALDAPHYLDHAPRFVSEFGWQSMPSLAVVRTMAGALPTSPEDPALIAHQKAHNGRDRLDHGMAPHVRRPTTFLDWHWATQLVQARALELALDHLRAQQPRCAGALLWQLNDCWPSISWAIVDDAGQEKPAFHVVRRLSAPRALGIVAPGSAGAGETLEVWLHNDADDDWGSPGTELTAVRRSFAGTPLAEERVPVHLPGRAATRVALPWSALPEDEVLELSFGGLRRLWFPAEYRRQPLRRPDPAVEVRREPGGWAVVVTADVLIRGLTLLVDELDPAGRVDEGVLDVLPGESATFHVTSGVEPPPVADVRAALRHANQLVAD